MKRKSNVNKVKYIFVTGGVLSSLGKGIAAASIGSLLECSGLKITLLKLDPYINIDPGTMNPLQHGEVYVTAQGPVSIGGFNLGGGGAGSVQKNHAVAGNVPSGGMVIKEPERLQQLEKGSIQDKRKYNSSV